MKVLAIIPARAGSKRLPGKNTRPFLGRPMIHWSIAFARSESRFSATIVSTDSDAIARCAEDAGLRVGERRPAHLAGDSAASVDVALHALAQAEQTAGESFDCVALLQPTSPLRDPRRWTAAFQLLEDDECEAVVGVSPARHHPAHIFAMAPGGALTPWGPAESLRTPSRKFSPAVAVNGSLYLIRAVALKSEQTFFPTHTCGVLCDLPWEAVDIDTEADWVAAEALARHYGIRE